MTVFWSGAALLVAITLWFLLPPLFGRGRRVGVNRDHTNIGLYKDRLAELRQELEAEELSVAQFEAAQAELQRDLINTTGGDGVAVDGQAKPRPWPALLVGILLPVSSVGIYWMIGAPELISIESAPVAGVAGDLDPLVQRLRSRLEREPGDVEGWKLLGRSYLYMGRVAEAAQATGRAVELSAANPDPDLLAEYADTLAMGSDGSLEGKPVALIKQALALQPDNPRALWLSGIHAYQQKDVRLALRQWRRLAAILPPDDEMAGALREAIKDAESLSRQPPGK